MFYSVEIIYYCLYNNFVNSLMNKKLEFIFRFCPSVFLYLGSVVPAIWLLELDKLERRMRVRDSNINISETLDLTNLAADDLKHLEKVFGVIFKQYF